jgi:carbonic anhydrase
VGFGIFVALPNPGLRLPTGEGEAVNNGHSVEVEAPAGGTIPRAARSTGSSRSTSTPPASTPSTAGTTRWSSASSASRRTGRSPCSRSWARPARGANAAYAPYAAAAEELTRTGQTEEVDLDHRALVPRASAGLRYEGSLTTPPCTEAVRWTVLTTPVQRSGDQVEAFNDVPLEQAPLGDNNRPLQPLNGRTVLLDVSRGFGANGG